MEWSTKIVYLICHYSEYVLSSSLSIYFTLLLCYRIIMLLSFTTVDFYLFIILGLLLCQYVLLTRSQCKVSDTLVTVKSCGPLDSNRQSWKQKHFIDKTWTTRWFYSHLQILYSWIVAKTIWGNKMKNTNRYHQ